MIFSPFTLSKHALCNKLEITFLQNCRDLLIAQIASPAPRLTSSASAHTGHPAAELVTGHGHLGQASLCPFSLQKRLSPVHEENIKSPFLSQVLMVPPTPRCQQDLLLSPAFYPFSVIAFTEGHSCGTAARLSSLWSLSPPVRLLLSPSNTQNEPSPTCKTRPSCSQSLLWQ